MSGRPIAEQARIAQAILRVAMATRDHAVDADVVAVYVEHLESFTVEVIEAACWVLELGQWMPKVVELKAQCVKEQARMNAEAIQTRLLALPAPKLMAQDLTSPKRVALVASVKKMSRGSRR